MLTPLCGRSPPKGGGEAAQRGARQRSEPREPGVAARFGSRRSSLEMVHWTISFAVGEPLLTGSKK